MTTSNWLMDGVAQAAADAKTAADSRDIAIRAAHAHGMTIRAIASATALSPSRVHQIIHGR